MYFGRTFNVERTSAGKALCTLSASSTVKEERSGCVHAVDCPLQGKPKAIADPLSGNGAAICTPHVHHSTSSRCIGVPMCVRQHRARICETNRAAVEIVLPPWDVFAAPVRGRHSQRVAQSAASSLIVNPRCAKRSTFACTFTACNNTVVTSS